MLLAIGGSHFLATAAHVVHDPTDEVTFSVAKGVAITFGSHSHVELRGLVHRTIPPAGEPYTNDRVDAALVEMSDADASAIDDAHFVNIEDIDVRDHLGQRRGYFLLGFPGSTAKPGSKPRSYKLTRLPYIGWEIDDADYAEMGYLRQSNLAVKFDRKNSISGGQVQSAPKPDGTSGGGWWRINRTFETIRERHDITLVAIMSKHYPGDEKALLAVRMSRIVQLLSVARPELKHCLPDVSFLPPLSLWRTLPGAFHSLDVPAV